MRMWVLKLRLSQKSLTEVQFYMIFNLFPSQRVPNMLADSQQSIQVTLSSMNLNKIKSIYCESAKKSEKITHSDLVCVKTL